MSSIKAWLHHCGVWICIAFFTASHHSLDICSTSIHAANGTTLSYKSLWFFFYGQHGQWTAKLFLFQLHCQTTVTILHSCDFLGIILLWFQYLLFFFHENIYLYCLNKPYRKKRKHIFFFFKFMIELVMLYAVCTLYSNASLVSGSLPQIDFVTVTLRTT